MPIGRPRVGCKHHEGNWLPECSKFNRTAEFEESAISAGLGKSRSSATERRSTVFGFDIDKHRQDYTVFCGEWNIGRIYEVRGGPEHLRWFWALHFPSKPENLRTDGRTAGRGIRMNALMSLSPSSLVTNSLT